MALLCAGCATTGHSPKQDLRAASAPVWSLQQGNDELAVFMSPTGRNLRLAGSVGVVLGTGVDAVVNARYRSRIQELIGQDDTAVLLADILEKALAEAAGPSLEQAAPLPSTAGFDSRRDAFSAYYDGLARAGHDVLLRLRSTHGIFGHDATLAVKLDGRLVELPSGHTLWANEIVTTVEPVMAYDRLGLPTDRMAPRIKGARLTVEEDALAKWESGGRSLRADFEEAAKAAASALVVNLGLAEDALGEYHLGELALMRKDFNEALRHYRKAISLNPDFPAAHNGIAVTLGHGGEIADAIETATAVTEQWPEFAPSYMNLAWWYATEKKDIESAQPYYRRALELGMAPVPRMNELLYGKGKKSDQ
jgi:tetratricopeptide (TPR) repeat protein